LEVSLIAGVLLLIIRAEEGNYGVLGRFPLDVLLLVRPTNFPFREDFFELIHEGFRDCRKWLGGV
jgi:hypothetical protein